MLGHSSVKQTESYAITDQATIDLEMTRPTKKHQIAKKKLSQD